MAGNGGVLTIRMELIAYVAEGGSEFWILPGVSVFLWGPRSVAIPCSAVASVVAETSVP